MKRQSQMFDFITNSLVLVMYLQHQGEVEPSIFFSREYQVQYAEVD